MKHQDGDTEWIKSFYDSAAAWWGESWYDGENLKGRLDLVDQCACKTGKKILELAAGTGEMAAYFCDHGYDVLAVDISHKNLELMAGFQAQRPNLRIAEGDFLKIQIDEQFPIVCMFEAFGIGSDREQQQLLKRVSGEWLTADGVLILDVYHPYGPIRGSGIRRELDRLPHVPGSVDMTEYCYYDPIKSRWIDIWEPKNDPKSRRVQSVRCFTPADFLLLAQNSGLRVEKMIFNGKEFDHESPEIVTENIFDLGGRIRILAYTVVMRKNVPR
jgi:SAM-dependent methyltransferase